MEKIGVVGSKKAQDDSVASDKGVASGDDGEAKKEPPVEKSEKEEVIKIEGNPGNQKRDRNSSSTKPKAPSRSTRSSNNPEFVAKQRHFLQKVNQGVFYQSSEEESDYSVTNGQNHMSKRKRSVSGGPVHSELGAAMKSTPSVDPGAGSNSSHTSSSPNVGGNKGSSVVKKRKYEVDELTRDIYCWVCHREMGISSGGSTLSCEVCPRVYHARCCHSLDPGSPHPSSPSSSSSNSPAPSKKGWACPECVKIVRAETMGTRSRAMQLITMDQLCTLLKFVLTRVRAVTGAEPFYGAVDLQQFPRYREFVANPMDLGLIDRNIRRRTYGSTEAFFADMKWLVHNSIIFNTQHSKLTSIARSMLKICRQELMEIENCPDCYSNAHTRKDNWFIDVCRRPHILVWAKLKGFPHWPAKAMRVNKEGCVDVRFFGAHDRAWVPARDCFLYSKEMPAPPKNRKKNNFDGCIMEVEDHIKKLKERFGAFVYSPLRTVYDPSRDEEIIMKMLPKFQPVNLDAPRSYSRNSLQEENVSRESPSMSTGTEEESDRDQSYEEESTSHKKEYETTFEDSMEIPSGCENSQPSENILSSTEDIDKAAEETTLKSEGIKKSKEDEVASVETKNEMKDEENKEMEAEENKEMEAEENKETEAEEKKEMEAEENKEMEVEENEEMELKEEKNEMEGKEKQDEVEAKGLKDETEGREKNNEMEVKETESETEANGSKSEEEADESEYETENKDAAKSEESVKRNHKEEAEDTKGLDKSGDNGKERRDNKGEIEQELTTSVEPKEKEADNGEKEVISIDASSQDDSLKISSSTNNESKSGNDESFDVEVVEKTCVDEEEEEKIGEEGEEKDGNDDETAVCAELTSDSEMSIKGKNNDEKGKMIHDKSDDVNDEDKKEAGERKAVATSEDEVEVEGEDKEASKTPFPPVEDKEDNAKSIPKEAESSVDSKEDTSLTESKDEKNDEVLEKSISDEDKEKSQCGKRNEGALVECDNEDSADGKLAALIDPNIEPEIDSVMKSSSYEGESSEPLPSVDSVSVEKVPENKSSEKSCDKADNGSLEKDGDENRAKLFQSLRLVNIETLYKHEVKEVLLNKGSLEEDKSKKDTAVGVPKSKFELPNKIDVNKLRESLMTKCANSAVTGSELILSSDSGASKNNVSSPATVHSEAKMSESKDVDANLDVDDEDATSDKPAKVSVVVTSPASNKGDVGSQLRVLGKLQQRLSFIKETTSESDEESTQEKEDENTVEDADSVTGDASGTSNSEDEDSGTPNDLNIEAEKGSVSESQAAEKSGDEAADINIQDKDVEGDSEKDSIKEDKNIDECNKDESKSAGGGEDKNNEGEGTKRKRKNEESEDIDVGEVAKVDKCSLGSETITLDGKPAKPPKPVESVSKEGGVVPGRKSKGKPLEVMDSGRASPANSKKQKLLEAKNNDSAKSRASPLNAIPEEVIEEEVLNREVLKESNMVVVQKTVKTRRVDEEPSVGSAPKRARKGIAQKAVIVDRSESPAHDEVFPSMFLDPSVTITVLQEAEKENGGSKEQSNGSTSVEELRTSVNLSNDVSLTMVRGTAALEGLAAVQNGAVSRSSEQQEVDILGQNAPNSVSPTPTQFRPRARKSFPRPSPRLYARSPQTPNQQAPSMEVRRLPNNSRDSSPLNLAGGASTLKAAGGSMVSMPVVAVRGVSAQPAVPLTTVTFSSSTLSTPSTSQGLVRTVISPVMPSTSVLVAGAQSNSASPRPPNLFPRPPSYPISGPQMLFSPSEAGPVSAEFSKHAHKLSSYMRQAIEDILGDLAKMGNPEAAVKSLRLEVEKLRWEHSQEVAELKHNQELVLSEIKASLEKERMRLVNEVRRQCEAEKLRAVEETKRKQWCANCSKEALFYCCWNTSYCDYPCQQTHWPRHMASCAQNNGMPESGNGDTNSSGNRKDGGSSVGHRGAAPPPPFHQKKKGGQKLPQAQTGPLSPPQLGPSAPPPLGMPNAPQNEFGESSKWPGARDTTSAHASQTSPFGGTVVTSKLTPRSHPKGPQVRQPPKKKTKNTKKSGRTMKS